MPDRLFKIYQRKRVVNINANVIAAGLLAIALAKYPVMWVAALIGLEHQFWISVAAYFIDMVFDGLVYFGLHWLANHWKPGDPQPVDRLRIKGFVRDALIVQAERFALVPVFAVIAIGGMWWLQRTTEIGVGWIFVITYVSAILITRVMHTVIGYRTGTFDDEKHAAKREAEKELRTKTAAVTEVPRPSAPPASPDASIEPKSEPARDNA